MGALIEKSQWLQCEGQKAIIEEARRQRPFCGWALLWCLNEPWPTVANQSLLAYPDEPKPAYEDVRLAMRPTLASARIPKFLWNAGEMFSADLFVLHDAPEPRPAISVRAVLTSGDWRSAPFEWHAEAGPSAADAVGPTLRVVLPKRLGTSLVLELLTDQPALNSSYRFATHTTAEIAPPDGATPRGLNT
jgi:beta-mannosidase